jgi:protein farnesyltransferase subunit beta
MKSPDSNISVPDMALSEDSTLEELRFRTDGIVTRTSIEQTAVERMVADLYEPSVKDPFIRVSVRLLRHRHIGYLMKGLELLPEGYETLDASQPWVIYWIVHSLCLLDAPIPQRLSSRIVNYLKKCQSPEGGFGGGPHQVPHLAPTYAAVLALCSLGTEEAYQAIDRPSLQTFLKSRHMPDGSFTMHRDGEVDIRGVYCAATAAILTNIYTPDMFTNSPEWLARCQTYEGGFAGEPGLEAHGGYSFCGYAALILLGKEHLIDTDRLLKWTVNRQMRLEGGFQGRTNKLVDGCYSFWVSGLLPLLYHRLKKTGDKSLDQSIWMFHQEALQDYILFCCQLPKGGLIDKPGK